MAQFDVFENPHRVQREGFPYLVVMQSDQLDHYSTRLVMPLTRMVNPPAALPRRLTQTVKVGGEALHPAALLSAFVRERLLRDPVVSLRSHADVLRDALDAVRSGV
ncbi:MAG: CcdB family protein [Rhizobacter sp.]|nr:CcdB family protein [Rhizobacter sp.]